MLPLLFRRLPMLAVLLLACVVATAAISPAGASAASQSFGYTGSVQTYTVPAGVNSLQVSATGGSGSGYYYRVIGGSGAAINSTIPATPGQTLYIYVGGNGGIPNGYGASGGYNGGGASGPFAGGGGGATDIRTSQSDLSSRILIAGGGGGDGVGVGVNVPGGNAGYPVGAAGGSSSYGTPGGGGTQQTGGAGSPSAAVGYPDANSGGLGSGGTGAFQGGEGGGGGGGGYYGGGGASGSSGGGGGSDYAEAGAYGTTYSTGGGAGVTITPVSSAIAVSPNSHDFGSVVVGQSSSAQRLTVTNNGSVPANISSVALSGANTGSFSISSDTCTGAAVATGGTCTLAVTFTPTSGASAGNAEQYVEVDVTSDAGDYGAALQGQGMISPVIMAMPNTWDFGTVTDGTSRNMQFQVYNESSASFVAMPTITGDTHHEYQVVPSRYSYCGPFIEAYFNAYGECDFEVSFTPNTADIPESATLIIANTNTNVGGSVSISLTGQGQSLPAISVPASHSDFGSVNDGASGTLTVTVTNTGDQSLTPGASTLTGANASRFRIANDGCTGQSLAKSATCTISLAFSPTAPGAQAATLNIPNNDPSQTGGTTAVSLTGTGVAGTLSVSPSPASFGSVNEGQTATRTFTVSDIGAGTVDISVDSVSGANASEFAISSDTCANTTLTPTGVTSRCTITAAYTASIRGAAAAQLGIASDAANATAHSTPVALSGTSLAPADISTTPAKQGFGSVTEGQNSAPATFTVTNTGDQLLNIGAATITGVDATQFVIVPGHDNCSNAAVPGAGTCTMQVAFHPASHGPQGATLTIPSNATSGSPVTISLLGSGVAPGDAAVSPSFGSYGALTAGQTPAAKTFTLTNPGDNALHVGTVAVTGPDAADFSIAGSSDSCSNQTVAGGASCSITVALTAAGRGARQAALTIPSDAASGYVTTVALAGTVLTPGRAFVDPSGKDFGTLTTGSSSMQTVTLLNSGDETLNVGLVSLTGADASDFTIVTDNCSGDSLAGGMTCTIQARFTPSHARAETANMSIPSNDPKSPTLVTLTGTGQAPAPTPAPKPKPAPNPPAPAPAPVTVTAPTLSGGGLTLQAGISSSHAYVILQLSAPGTVTATVKRDDHGNWVMAATQTIAAPKAGAVRLPLGSRAWGHALATGKYRVTVIATSGGQTSKPLNLSLTVTPMSGRRRHPRLPSVRLAADHARLS